MVPAADLRADVLVIDDDEVMLQACRAVLERHGWQVWTTTDPFEGRGLALRGAFDVLLLDLRMPGLDGMDVLSIVREYRSDLEIVIMTAYSSVDTAVRAIKLGAFDYVAKPFTPDELLSRVTAAAQAVRERRKEGLAAGGVAGTMVGDSEPMRQVRALIDRVGRMEATALIVGESGTGKELVAAAIHAVSPRRDRPFVSIDCSALAPSLLESELFGHVKGAFTGATVSKPGLFEVADKGTVFLDEVGNLSAEIQGKLLRVLETSEIRPVGSVDLRKVDIRLVAATNRDLAEVVRDGGFREDLYYRLKVVPILLPALRHRTADIPALAAHFLGRYARKDVRGPRRFSREALERLCGYPWPGNVRELRNLVERLVVTVDDETIRAEHLPEYVLRRPPDDPANVPHTSRDLRVLKRAMRERTDAQLERLFVLEALRRNDWNVTRAAQQTGMLRPNFRALMRKHRIRVRDLKG